MPVINVASQGEFIIDKTFSIKDKLVALYTNGLVQDITGFESIYDHESIELPDPIILVSSSFSDDSDADIADIITLAKAGTIDLSDYWTVGDTRTVNLSAMAATGVGELHAAQDVEFVIMHDFQKNGSLGGIMPRSGTKGFIIAQKDSLNEGGYMNSSNTNSGSWNSSARRTWCNNVYHNALPNYFKNNTTDMTIKTASNYDASYNTDSVDKVALFAAKEIFGGTATTAGASTSYSNLTEFNALTQVEYYKTAANRIKKMNGSAYNWWERSPNYNNATFFCDVNGNGSANYSNASNARGLAPFFCITY